MSYVTAYKLKTAVHDAYILQDRIISLNITELNIILR